MPGPLVLRRAVALYVAAGVCFCTLDATAKWLVQDYSTFLVVWARYAGQLLLIVPFAIRHAGPGFWRTARPGLHLVRGLALVAATGFFFSGLRYLPLAEGSSITYLAPIFVVLLAWPMLGERSTPQRLLAAILGFVGVLVLVRPGSAVFHPATLLLLATALCNAVYALLTRKLQAENPYTLLFYSALVGAAGLSFLLPVAGGRWPSGFADAARFLLLGGCAFVGHGLFIRAFQLAPASLLTPFTYLQVLWATLFGALVFGHLPDPVSFVGMAIIVASGLLLAIHERHRSRAGAARPNAR